MNTLLQSMGLLEAELRATPNLGEALELVPDLLKVTLEEQQKVEDLVFKWRDRAISTGKRFFDQLTPVVRAESDLAVYACARFILEQFPTEINGRSTERVVEQSLNGTLTEGEGAYYAPRPRPTQTDWKNKLRQHQDRKSPMSAAVTAPLNEVQPPTVIAIEFLGMDQLHAALPAVAMVPHGPPLKAPLKVSRPAAPPQSY